MNIVNWPKWAQAFLVLYVFGGGAHITAAALANLVVGF